MKNIITSTVAILGFVISSSAFALVAEKDIDTYIQGKVEKWVTTSLDASVVQETKGHKIRIVPNTFKLEKDTWESIGATIGGWASGVNMTARQARIQVIDDTTLKIYQIQAAVGSTGDLSVTGNYKNTNEVVSKDGKNVSKLFKDSDGNQDIAVIIFQDETKKTFLILDKVVNP